MFGSVLPERELICYVGSVTGFAPSHPRYPTHRAVYNVQCIVYTIHCTMYIVQCTLYNVHCTLYLYMCTYYQHAHISADNTHTELRIPHQVHGTFGGTYFHMFAYVFTCLHIFAHICIYLHIFAHICTYLHIFTQICTYLHKFAQICIYLMNTKCQRADVSTSVAGFV